MSKAKLPCYFIAHGSPLWIGEPNSKGPEFLKSLGKQILSLPQRPKSLIIISAHWETQPEIRISSADQHNLLYDYYGFPKHFYDVKYPAKGDPLIANKAKALLEKDGFVVENDHERGLDHGIFIPLMYM